MSSKLLSVKSSWPPLRRAIISYACLAVSYIILIFALPPNHIDMHMYNLSSDSYHILLFAITVPSILIWFVGFYSYAQLQCYVRSLAGSPEEQDFKRLANGVRWLVWSLPVSALVNIILNSIANTHIGFYSAAIIISNYVALILPLIGFSLISSAAHGLLSRAQTRLTLSSARFIILVFVVLGVLYCYFTFRHFNLSSFGSLDNPYHLPVWLMVLTVAIPYLYAWFVGLLASYELMHFSNQVTGVLYRQALRLLAGGTIAVVISSIGSQYSSSVSPHVGYFVLNHRLLFSYLFRVIAGAGYVLIAFGVSRLHRIEAI
ncbi:MAG TPA: hypothetical protein VG992_02550 [Candidatus Saccharimonadales bacterium]|nr:hypothetical protein [Candidatus Saccharimonadales bacterium]